jgi:hypothetical protein
MSVVFTFSTLNLLLDAVLDDSISDLEFPNLKLLLLCDIDESPSASCFSSSKLLFIDSGSSSKGAR